MGSVAVGFHHALKGTFEAFSHAVAVAHNAFHDAELAHVARHEFFHAVFQHAHFIFEFRDLSGGIFGLGVNQTGGQQHFFDAVDGSSRQSCGCSAVNALVVGACAEHGGHFAKVVLQGGVKFGFVQGQLAQAIDAQAHVAGSLYGGARGGRSAGDHAPHLVAHRLQQAFASQHASEIFDFAGAVAQNFEGFFKIVVGGDQAFDVVFDACGVAVQVESGRACGVGKQVEGDTVDHIADGVAAACHGQSVDFEVGVGGRLQVGAKADASHWDFWVGSDSGAVVTGQAEIVGHTCRASHHHIEAVAGIDELGGDAQLGPIDGADHARRGGGGDLDVASVHAAHAQVELERGPPVQGCGTVGKNAAGRALRQRRLKHFNAVAACFCRGAGGDAKGGRLRVAGLDGAEVAGVVELGEGVFELGERELDSTITGDLGFGLRDLGFDAFFFRCFFGVHQALRQSFHVDA